MNARNACQAFSETLTVCEMTLRKAFDAILAVLAETPVTDTHEHLRPPSSVAPELTASGIPGLLRHSYVRLPFRRPDGVANGMSDSFETSLRQWDPELMQGLELNAYWVWLRRGLAALYGMPDGSWSTNDWTRLDSAIRAAYLHPETWFADVLARARIEAVVWDPFWKAGTWTVPDARFVPSFRINSTLVAYSEVASDFEGSNLARDWGPTFDIEVTRVQDVKDLVDRIIERNVHAGCRSLKSAIAYDRDLLLTRPDREAAARAIGRAPDEIEPSVRRAFEDEMIRFLLEQARDRGLVVQVHTGMARLTGSSPMHLAPILEEYPDVTFDIFHGGYPWVHEVAALAHNYPNVRLNLTWLPQLTTSGAISALKEWLQLVGDPRRLSWGGDCVLVEEAYGALLAARHTVARALAELTNEGYVELPAAERAARAVLRDGGAEIYGFRREQGPAPHSAA
jgi:hypothetical protein